LMVVIENYIETHIETHIDHMNRFIKSIQLLSMAGIEGHIDDQVLNINHLT